MKKRPFLILLFQSFNAKQFRGEKALRIVEKEVIGAAAFVLSSEERKWKENMSQDGILGGGGYGGRGGGLKWTGGGGSFERAASSKRRGGGSRRQVLRTSTIAFFSSPPEGLPPSEIFSPPPGIFVSTFFGQNKDFLAPFLEPLAEERHKESVSASEEMKGISKGSLLPNNMPGRPPSQEGRSLRR